REGGFRSEGGDSRREPRREGSDTKRAGKNYRERTDSKLNKNKKRKKVERR
ncbi:MAG: hypothetical protein HW410_1069, partial [Nitrosarchaeum sp.]|nr:hypothetical protein [Nitrosarchaeum sp.]